MNDFNIQTRKLNLIIALFTLVQGIFLLVYANIEGFFLDFNSAKLPIIAVSILVLISVFYSRYRPDPRIASATRATAHLIAVTIIGAPLSYIMASLNWPLLDSYFNAFDQTIRLSWEAYFNFVVNNYVILFVFTFAYETFIPAVIVIIIILSWMHFYRHLFVFVASFNFMTFITIIISGILPAVNPYYFYKYTPAFHPSTTLSATTEHFDVLFSLRNGALRSLSLENSIGIITFPSLHAAAGMAFILALWPVAWLRWFGMSYGVAVIAATPVCGSHYFADVLAGVIIACLSFILCSRLDSKPFPEKISEAIKDILLE